MKHYKKTILKKIDMNKKYIIITTLTLIALLKICDITVTNRVFYVETKSMISNSYIYGETPKRGRILDRNGVVLVDNKETLTITYKKLKNTTTKDELEIAEVLSTILSMGDPSELEIKKYLLAKNDYDYLITSEEKELYNERKLTDDDIKKLLTERIDVTNVSQLEIESSKIYSLMTANRLYEEKVIKADCNPIEYAEVLELNLTGVEVNTSFERFFTEDTTLNSILGSTGKIYEEDKDYYLNLGYSLNDLVGTSYLEKEYEEYLRGEKAIYKVNSDGSLMLIKEEIPGNDLYLSIDLTIQKELERTMEEEMLVAKTMPNTKYFTDSFVSISDPQTGAIVALSGKRLQTNNKSYSFLDITRDVLTSSYTLGSVVKGATISVGYNNDLIDSNKYIPDDCVKLYLVPEKCSWKELGSLNDIDALKNSSNYYQYLLAINLTGSSYSYNMKFDPGEEYFDIYRNTLEEYGLGTFTGIDLPNEQVGNIGKIVSGDLLLNLAIGQYDTYTLLGLNQYMNTVATGKRYSLSLMDKIISPSNELILQKTYIPLNVLTITNENLQKIQNAFNEVITGGTGIGYIDAKYNPAGKTGTSESFLDTDNDGIVDTKTISLTFAGYAPVDDPKYSIAVISPHIAYYENEDDDYYYRVHRMISNKITTFLFDNY